jgi:hypothetical protein
MFILRKRESPGSQWPFHPWPARRSNAIVGWKDATPERTRRRALSRLRGFSLVAVAMFGVIMFAGVAIERFLADEPTGAASPATSQSGKETDDERLSALLSEHRRVVRGY